MTKLRVLLACVAFGLVPPASAHDDATHDKMTAPHGGQLRAAGAYHFELVAKPNELTVYITDHADAKVSSAGAKATATVLTGKDKTTANLTSGGDNMLKGTGTFDVTTDTRVVLSVQRPGEKTEQARFTPGAKLKPQPKKP